MQENTGKYRLLTSRKDKKAGRNAAREILLFCATVSLSPRVKERLGKTLSGYIDWEYFMKLAAYQGVMPLVTYNLSTGGFSSLIPEYYTKQFKRAYKYTVYRNVLLSNELVNVVAALRNQGIETVCLKGTALAEVFYGNACLRPVTDMDILVHSEDRVRVNGIVAGLGYKPKVVGKGGDHPFHQEYFKEAAFTLFLELHWNLENRQLVAFPEDKLWSRAQPLEQNGIASQMLSPEDNLMFLANHLFKHNTHRLKLLCDISELLKKYEGTLDWDYIISSARSWQIKPALYYSLKQAKDLLGAPVPTGSQIMLRPDIWRRLLLVLFTGQESFTSQSAETKLNREMAALSHSLMMKSAHEMVAVLTRYRGQNERAKWLRAAFWTAVVIVAGLGRSLTRLHVNAA